MMSQWPPVIGERLFDVFFNPATELRASLLPLLQPDRQVSLGLLQTTPIIQPAQLHQAVPVGLARQMIESIAQEVNIATLPSSFRQNLSYSLLEAAVIISNRQFDTAQASLAQALQKLTPAVETFPKKGSA
jgi:hypothetical protein